MRTTASSFLRHWFTYYHAAADSERVTLAEPNYQFPNPDLKRNHLIVDRDTAAGKVLK